jgi:hypothetical protein
MQDGEHHLGSALALVGPRRVRIDRDTTTVVVDTAPTVGQNRHSDAVAEPGHRLVDGVVDHLPDEVMETGQTGGSDVHPRALPDRVETLQHLDVFGAVIGSWLVGVGGHSYLDHSQEKQAVAWIFVGNTDPVQRHSSGGRDVGQSLPWGCLREVEGTRSATVTESV